MSSGADTGDDEVEDAVLAALVDGPEAGMTVFELRSHVDYDIEALEPALANLREADMITVEYGEDRSVIKPKEHVRENARDPDPGPGWLERVRRFLFS